MVFPPVYFHVGFHRRNVELIADAIGRSALQPEIRQPGAVVVDLKAARELREGAAPRLPYKWLARKLSVRDQAASMVAGERLCPWRSYRKT